MKEDKVDLVMWTKNGEAFLPMVLKRIDKVVPSESISNKIMVDDASTDGTVKIGKSYNWEIYQNPEGGVSSGANEALRHVGSRRFVSVEQDLVLAENWWEKIPPLLRDGKVVAASGVRVPDMPVALRRIGEYTNLRYFQEMKTDPGFRYGKTIDNTIYRTELLRKIGGFPRLRINAGVDTALAKKISDSGCFWKVDFNVKSIHLRQGFVNELRHGYWYGKESVVLSKELEEEPLLASMFARTLFSPFRGIQIAYNKMCWQISLAYPLMRFSTFLGVLRGFSNQRFESAKN